MSGEDLLNAFYVTVILFSLYIIIECLIKGKSK